MMDDDFDVDNVIYTADIVPMIVPDLKDSDFFFEKVLKNLKGLRKSDCSDQTPSVTQLKVVIRRHLPRASPGFPWIGKVH
jgi:hypothetical protein